MKPLRSLLASVLLSSALFAGTVYAQDAGGGAAAAAAPAAAASAPAAAAPTSSVASASPSATQTPASTSATDSSAAAAATSTAETPSAGLTQNDGESSGDFLLRVMQAKSGTAPETVTKVDDPAAPGEEKPAVPGEETPAEPTTAEESAEGEGEDNGYDPYIPPTALAPKELSEKINGNAALKAALDADPELRNTLYAQSRLAAETSEFKKVFANPEEAKVAAAGNSEFSALSELVTSIEKPEDAQGFYAKLLDLSVLHDDDGNPILQDGKPVSDGTVGRLIHHTGALFLNHFEQVAQTSGDDELTAAVEILKARAFGGPASTNSEEFTEEQNARAKDLETRETTLKAQEQAAKAAKTEEFNQSIVSGIDAKADSAIGKLLERTDIPDKDRGDVAEKIRKAAYELIVANPQFRAEQDLLMRRQPGAKTREARIGLGQKWLNVALPIVAPKLISEAGNKILARQAQRQAAQSARQDASRSEAEGSLRVSRPTTGTSGQDVMNTATATLKAKLGREPNTGEVMGEVMRMRSAQ